MNKALKYVVIFILSVSFGGLMVVLFLPKDFEFTHEIDIDKPAAYCWAYFMDDNHRADWSTNFDELVYLEGEPGKEGARRTVFYKEDTARVRIVETILEVDSPFHVKYREEIETLMQMTTDIKFEVRDSNSCYVTSKLEAVSLNRLFKFFMFGTKKGIKKQKGDELEKLKTLIEKGGLEARSFHKTEVFHQY